MSGPGVTSLAADLLAELGRERRLQALEARAERDGVAHWGSLSIAHYSGLKARTMDGRFAGSFFHYGKRLPQSAIARWDHITRDEALKLLGGE